MQDYHLTSYNGFGTRDIIMEMILLGFVSAASLVIMILLFFLGVFVVRSQERTRAMISQLVQILLEEEDAPQPASQPSLRPKTWDEKYEQELEAAQRRLREVSGLTDPSR